MDLVIVWLALSGTFKALGRGIIDIFNSVKSNIFDETKEDEDGKR